MRNQDEVDLSCYILERSKESIGFLLLDHPLEKMQDAGKISNFINEMLRAINIRWVTECHRLSELGDSRLLAAKIIIAMGESVSSYAAGKLQFIQGLIVAREPRYYLSQPLEKKQVWQKIRIFT